MIDLDVKVKPTALSLRFITESLKCKDERWDELRATKTLKDVQFSVVSGNGYLSTITRISFFFEGQKEPFSVILKVPTVENVKRLMGEAAMKDEKRRAKIEMFATDLVAFHNKEVRFYDDIGIRIRHVSLPKIYGAQGCDSVDELGSAFLLMEDLGPNGGLADVRRGLSKEQVDEVIKVIAEFHAYSLTFPKELLEDLPLPTFGEHKENGADDGDTMMNKLLELHVDYFKKHEKALRKIVRSVKLGDDLNLHKTFDTGLTDICRLLLLGVNARLKVRSTDDWLRLYFDTFEESTKHYGVDCPYTLELVRKMFYAHYTPQLIFAAFLLSHMCEIEEDEHVRTVLTGRIISGFEIVRRNFE